MPLPKTPKVKVPPLSIAAPDVMTRSSITDLANRVRQSEGQFGAQRVERAADEIPNLEKLYQDQALMRAFTGDNAQALMTMKPSDFERFAAPLDANLSDRSLQKIADITGFYNNGGFSDVPYLYINKKEQGTTGLPWITGHEGRHRNRVMDAAGEQAGLVQLLPRAELREPFPRKSQEQYIEALYKEMQLTDNRVKPERYDQHITDDANRVVDIKDVQRRAIDLPDLYAQGGIVDSAPEEAIKNTIKDPQAFRMLDMDLANLALMSQKMQQPPRRMAGGGKASDDIMSLKPQPKPAVPTVRELVAEIGKNPTRYEAKYPPKDATPIEMQAYQLMQAAKKTPDASRYLESLNPYFDSQLRFDIGAGSDAGYVKFKEPNVAVMQQLKDVKNTIPHELTHTLQLGKGKDVNPNLENNHQTFLRQNDLSQEMRDKVFPSSNVTNMKEVWANVAARAHEVNAAGGDFINSPEGRALFPTNTEQRDYYTNAMPGVNSMTPSTGTFVPNKAEGGAIHMEHGGVTPRAFSYSPTDRDEHNRKLGLPAEFYRAGQVDPTMQSYGAGVSVPVGGARLTADALGSRNAQMRDTLAGIMLGAEFPVGEGTLRAETMRPTMQGASPTYGLRYNQRFAQGGQVQRFDEGGEVSQSELDRMRYELDRANSPVMQATPRSPIQDFIGTAGGYMDKAGRFITQAIEPIAEKNPVKTFLADMLLAAPLRGAGTLMQDLTGTVRETDEDNPVRGVISKDFRNLTTSREPMLDPRVLDIAQFATPVVRGATKLVGAGAKAIEPFATRVDDMVRELYTSGAMPQPGLSIKDVTPRVLAPANEQGFYSPTEAAALNLQRKSGNGQAFLNDLLKQENVKPDEISAMGLDTFLKDKKNVTAAEVQDYIAKNKVQLGESLYGGNQPTLKEWLASKGHTLVDAGMSKKEIDLIDQYRKEFPDKKETKFDKYTLPGGENYREVVLTMPEKGRIPTFEEWHEKTHIRPLSELEKQPTLLKMARERYEKEKNNMPKEGNYQSSHWDEPNPLAHLRMSDRVTDGKKTLLVDEVQSDWHQAGREKGYKSDFKPVDWNDPEYVKARSDSVDATNAFNRASGNPALQATLRAEMDRAREVEVGFANVSNKINRAVPDAPFKDDWYQLALRRAIKEAIDGGYDRVALPTGARVAERFDLSKQVDRIVIAKLKDGTFAWNAQKDGRIIQDQVAKNANDLSLAVGKDLARKAEAQTDIGANSIYEGDDLRVGGEGMKKYYDEIYPGYLKKFGKKYGATVGKTDVVINDKVNEIFTDNGKFYVDAGDGINFIEFNTRAEAAKHLGTGVEPLHYMEITPAMREAFKTGIHMKKGGKVSFADSLDAMRHELTKAK